MHTFYTKGQPFRWARLLSLLLLMLPLAGRAQYTPNNAVVVRIGDGTAVLSANAAPVSLLEYKSTGGAAVTTVNLNSAATGLRLTTSGSGTSEGALFHTADGLQLSIAGYDAAAATATVTASANGRSLATINASGTPTIQAAPSTLGTKGTHRSLASVGTGFYSGTSGGEVQYYANPSTSTSTATQLSTAAPTNIRVVGVYGGQLYATSGSGAFIGLNTIGTGTPTTSGQTTTLIAPVVGTGPSPYGFVLLDQSASETGFDVAYIADDRSTAEGGVYKFSKVSGTWTANGLIATMAGTRHLAARLTGTGVELYVATSTALYTFSDNSGYNAFPTVTFPAASIATAGSNYAFRGVAFAPDVNPVPTITSLSPSSATAGSPAQTLTVNGTNFMNTAVVNFNGTNRTTTYVSATQLTIQLTTADLLAEGSYDVTVKNPTPGGGTTAASVFTVSPAPVNNPVPTITSLSPSSVIAGTAAQTLTVNGTNFIGTSVVNFAGTARTITYVSATQLTIQLTAGDQATLGSYNVTVTNPTPGGGTTVASTFTVTNNPVPTIASLSPSSVFAGAAAQTLTVTGTNFGGTSVVNFNGTARTTTYLSATQLTIQLTAGDQAMAGGYNVTVTNPTPGGGTTAPSTFTVNVVPAPTLTAISPSNPVGGATYAFTLTGTTFGTTANTTVSFNGSNVVPTSVNGTGTSLVVSLLLPAAGGTFPITVTTINGTSGSQSLTVAAAPAGFFEPFEPGARGGYIPAGSVTLRTGSYDFVYALLGNITPPGDKFNNIQSVRMQGGGSITMGFDKTGGAGMVTISAARYGSDVAASLTLEYSTDGGMTFLAAPGSPVALSTTLTAYSFTLNVVGNVRLRIGTSNTANGTSPRINIDDLQITNYSAPLTDLTVNTGTPLTPTPITGNYNNVTIATGGYAILAGPLTVAGTLTIKTGGGLSQNCQLLTGTGDFDLQAGGTLAICDAAGISPTGVPTGAVLLAGTRTYSPLAQYIYIGNAAQVTGLGLPGTILALGVQNFSGVTLSQALSLTQGVNLNLGNLNTSGQTFTLLSSAAGTAGVVNTGGVVVGAATVQRYINSSNELGYRHYSSPVRNTTLADLSAPGFTPTFNPAYNSSATPGTVTPFPTVFGYDQDRLATVTSNFSAFDKGWFSPFGSDVTMVVAKGYSVNAPNTALVDFVGTLNNGNISTGTLNRGSDPNAGWQLVGNPYPAPIDWSTITAGQRPGMDAAVYVFESAGQYGGSYRSNVNGVGGNGNTSPLIVSGSGCFVRVSTPNGTGSVNLTNANRVTTFGPQPSFGRGTADLRPQVTLTLQGASVMDDASVYFQAGATAGKDVEFDATKLANPHGLNLSSLAGGEALAINGLPVLGTATVLVPLNVAAPKAGSYSLRAGALANLAGTTVTLLDALTGTRTALTTGTVYAFSLSSTTATGRFSLEFRPSGALAATAAQALSAQTQLFPNPASGSFRVQLPVLAAKTAVQATLLNTLGQTVLSRSLSAAAGQALDTEFDVRALAAGVYTLRLDVAGTLVTRKVVVE